MESRKYNHLDDTNLTTSVSRFIVCCVAGLPFALVPKLLFKKDTPNEAWNIFAVWATGALPMFYWVALSKTVAIKAGFGNTRAGQQLIG